MRTVLTGLALTLVCGAAQADDHLVSERAVGCIAVAEVKPDMTPPDLMNGVYSCAAAGDPKRGGMLMFTATARALFDSMRVADPSAARAWDALMDTMRATLSGDEIRAMVTAGGEDDYEEVLCSQLIELGLPEHDPAWMIAHGNGRHDGPALQTDYDAEQNWEMGMAFGGCHG